MAKYLDELVRRRVSKRRSMEKRAEDGDAITRIGDAINTGPGRAAGGLIAKMILGGRQGEGRVKFSETPAGKRREFMRRHKGIAANREFGR